MDKLYFNTINESKVSEIREIFKDFEIGFLNNDITEILSQDLISVIKSKASQAYEIVRVPIIVEHGALEIEYLNSYPSALSKPMWDMLEGNICNLIPEDENRNAMAKSAVCYCDGINYNIHIGETKGTISKKSRGSKGFQWDPIFIPANSDKTYAEMSQTEKLRFSQAAKAYHSLMLDLSLRF